MNLAVRQVFLRRSFRLCERVSSKCAQKQIPITSICPLTQFRNYCNEKSGTRELPQLMEFPIVIWPSFFKFVKNWMFANFIIKPYYEPEFSIHDFIEGSKQAVQVVSESLKNGDFQALDGLVDNDAITALKNAISKLTVSQRHMLAIEKSDIFYAFPYQIGLMFEEEKRWVEITMCYHVMKGLKQMQETGNLPPISLGVEPEYAEKIYVLNYRFIREFTKGVEDSWLINIVNHFQPQVLRKM